MAVYVDPPLWPAHGTHFSHLVSDTSLAELHAFAAAAGIPGRAFDGDHYDVAEARYEALVAAGAIPVEGRVLVRKLIASGLRIPARRRGKALRVPLLNRWNEALPGHDALFLDLLDRWGEEHRKYHGRTHLLAVLEALDLLCDPADPPRTVLLAAWFHDAVYRGVAGQDEEESARLADDRLRHAGLPAAEVDEVVRLVLLTADHCPEPGDDDGALLSDADLSVLGGEPEAYARYLAAVREDFAHIGDADFAAGRAAVVRQLLQLDPLFHTDRGRTLWLDAGPPEPAGRTRVSGAPASHRQTGGSGSHAEVIRQPVERLAPPFAMAVAAFRGVERPLGEGHLRAAVDLLQPDRHLGLEAAGAVRLVPGMGEHEQVRRLDIGMHPAPPELLPGTVLDHAGAVQAADFEVRVDALTRDMEAARTPPLRSLVRVRQSRPHTLDRRPELADNDQHEVRVAGCRLAHGPLPRIA